MTLASYIARKTFNSFRHSFARSILLLSIFVTSSGLAVMIIAYSIFSGFQQEVANKVFGFWGHIHVTDLSVNRSVEPIMISLRPGIIDSIKQTKVKGKQIIEHIQSFIIVPGIIGKDDQHDGLFLKGVNVNYDWKFLENYIKKGRGISYQDTSFSREIVLSEQTAVRLQLDTGQYIIAHFVIEEAHIKRKLKIVGTYKTGLEEYDLKFALVDQRLLQSLLQLEPNQVTGLEIKCSDISKVESLNELLYTDVLPTQWYGETIRNKFPNIFEWLALQNTNKYFILGLILMVCIINMATTLLILILERSHMIGVLQTLGMPFIELRKIFLLFGARIIAFSLIIGNVIGFGLCYLQDKYKWIRLSETDYYLSYAPVDLSVGPVLILNGLVFLIIWVSLLLPAMLVQKIQPVDALKFR